MLMSCWTKAGIYLLSGEKSQGGSRDGSLGKLGSALLCDSAPEIVKIPLRKEMELDANSPWCCTCPLISIQRNKEK